MAHVLLIDQERDPVSCLILWIFDAPPSGFTACFDAQMSRARAWAGEVPARAVGGGGGGGGGV